MNLFIVFGITLVVFLLVIAGMAVGVLMGRRRLSGSCGGLANRTDAEGNTACSLCSEPDAACKELGRRMEGSPSEPARQAGSQLSDNEPSGGEGSGGEGSGGDCEKDCAAEGCEPPASEACKRR